LGENAEIARRMMLEIDLARERLPGVRFVFVGKTAVYSVLKLTALWFVRAEIGNLDEDLAPFRTEHP
jgi:hypothetical protein